MTTDDTEPSEITAAVVAIGNLAVGFASLELMLHSIVWEVIAPARLEVAPRITENMQAGALADLLARLAPFSDEEERLQQLVTDFRRVSKVRNDALHSIPLGAYLHNRTQWVKAITRDAGGSVVPPSGLSADDAQAAFLDCFEIQQRAKEVLVALAPN